MSNTSENVICIEDNSNVNSSNEISYAISRLTQANKICVFYSCFKQIFFLHGFKVTAGGGDISYSRALILAGSYRPATFRF